MEQLILEADWKLSAVHSETTPHEALALPVDIPAIVPGDIASDLLASGLINDPYYGRNELDLLWIGRTDWRLSTIFTLSSKQLKAAEISAFLSFDSIDTVAEVRVNDTLVGQSRNMFRSLVINIPEALAEGENHLEITIHSPEAYTEAAAEKLPYPIPHSAQFPWQWNHRNLLRKVACHGGWDWGLTLMTGGLNAAPVLSLGAPGRIEYITSRQVKHPGSDSWILEVTTEYLSLATGDIVLEYSLDGLASSEKYSMTPGLNTVIHSIEVSSPELWWPAGQGNQKLYELIVKSPDETIAKKIGFRTVEVVVEDDHVGRSMSFRVNGRDIFAKGANWIPVDAFPARHTDDVYHRLLADAAEANMNMIRLWGGGQYEKDVFYEICDELGLMIWHDMMFACSLYPSDSEFLAEADAEVRHQIKRLKDHPSIVLWCGNNEDLGALNWFPESRENRDRYVVDYDRLNEGVVGNAVKELDPDRTWWPSSPSAGEGDYSDCWHDDTKGDMHYWSVWHEGLSFESYYDVVPRFCSEFGFQSFPCERTVASYAPEGQRNLTSPTMRHHQKNNAGNSIILSTMLRYFRMPSSLGDQLYLSQVQQAWAIRTAVDYWRANRPVSMGALYWQLNDNWPVASWSSLEYDGTWKLLHYEAKRFFAPLRFSLYKKGDSLYVAGVNDAPADAQGTLTLSLMGFDGTVLEQIVLDDLQCPAGKTIEFFSKPLAELAAPEARQWVGGPKPHDCDSSDVVEEGFTDRFITAEWTPTDSESESASLESLMLTKPRDCELADAAITVSPGSESGSILLETDAPAFYVQAETAVGGRFSDAGFTLLPERPIELKWLPPEGVEIPPDLSAAVTVRHLRSTY